MQFKISEMRSCRGKQSNHDIYAIWSSVYSKQLKGEGRGGGEWGKEHLHTSTLGTLVREKVI